MKYQRFLHLEIKKYKKDSPAENSDFEKPQIL